ncbi:MAG: hypothetical protein R2761_29590 [Acidimicrobiales bacterium]
MTGPAPGGGGPGNSPATYDDDLRVLLAAHGASHEPDLTRIRARLDAGLATARRRDGAGGAGHRRRLPVRLGAAAAVGLVAAAAVLIAVIGADRPVEVSTIGPATAVPVPGRPDCDHGADGSVADGADGAGAGADDPATPPPPLTPAGGADRAAGADPGAGTDDVPGIRVPAGDPEPSASTVVPGADPGAGGAPGIAPGDGSSGSTTAGAATVTTTNAAAAHPTTGVTAPPATTAPPQPLTTAGPISVPPPTGPAIQVGLLPPQVLLGPTGQLDWVVVGSRSDGKTVRMKTGPGRLTVSAPSGALATPALIPILWSGGSPEQDRTSNSTWWTANGSPSSFVVQVAGADNASEVTLYAASSSSLSVTVAVSGRGTSQKVVPGGFLGSAGKVTVSLTGADRGRDVTITLGAAKGSVSLGAVTER